MHHHRHGRPKETQLWIGKTSIPGLIYPPSCGGRCTVDHERNFSYVSQAYRNVYYYCTTAIHPQGYHSMPTAASAGCPGNITTQPDNGGDLAVGGGGWQWCYLWFNI